MTAAALNRRLTALERCRRTDYPSLGELLTDTQLMAIVTNGGHDPLPKLPPAQIAALLASAKGKAPREMTDDELTAIIIDGATQ